MEQAELRAPSLRQGVEFRRLAAGRVLVSHPQAAAQIWHTQIAEAVSYCQGQPWTEMFTDVSRVLNDTYTSQEWADVLAQVADFGFFEGRQKRTPRVRLFDPAPALDFLVRRCGWLFTTPTAVILFGLLFAGIWQLLAHWAVFLSSVNYAAGVHPLLTITLFYFCFVPVGLLHELAHGLVCRWEGGDVVEVGFRTHTANLYVLSNTAPLVGPRKRILYFAGGAFLDMLMFFLLLNLWLRWPNYVLFMLLLPQAMFVLQFSYAMEDGSDLSRIIAEWTEIPEAKGRWPFLKSFFEARPKNATEWKRAAVYLGSITLQLVVAGLLIWSVRKPVALELWGGIAPKIPFLPVLVFFSYRWLRRGLMALPGLFRSLRKST